MCQDPSVADPAVEAVTVEGNRENGTSSIAGRQNQSDLPGKVKRTIGWINSNVLEKSKIYYDSVAPDLAALTSGQALGILRSVQENADTMADATYFVRVRALKVLIRNLEREAAHTTNNTEKGTAGDVARYKKRELNIKVARAINGINRASILETPLRYDKVAEYLVALPPASAIRVLTRLSEKNSTIKDPTHYIQVACLTYLGNRLRTRIGENGTASAVGNSTRPLDGKVHYTMVWLNKNGGLNAQIKLVKVAKALGALPVNTSSRILRQLQDGAAKIQDPSRWIMRAALDQLTAELEGDDVNAAEGGAANFAAQRTKWDLDSRVKNQIHWVNSNSNLAAPIRYNKVEEPLAAIPVQQALRIVKITSEKPKNKANRDPTKGVLIQALRARVAQLRSSLQRAGT